MPPSRWPRRRSASSKPPLTLLQLKGECLGIPLFFAVRASRLVHRETKPARRPASAALSQNLHWRSVRHIDNPRYMESTDAIDVLVALGQPTRLDAFRLVMRHEPHGLPAGEIARLLEVPQNTMSTHLAVLTRAGLISSERHIR